MLRRSWLWSLGLVGGGESRCAKFELPLDVHSELSRRWFDVEIWSSPRRTGPEIRIGAQFGWKSKPRD